VLDAVVVGAGPNGLAAAITLARAGQSVHVIEAADAIGGGVRSAELTLPGFVHDVCSAIYPMGIGSPFFRDLPLAEHGLQWVHPELPLAHPLEGGRAVALRRSLDGTAEDLGEDGPSYAELFRDLTERWRALMAPPPRRLADVVRPTPGLLRTGLAGLAPAARVARRRFATEGARALWAGLAAHGMQPLARFGTGGFALSLGAAAHAVGWPFVRGGAQGLAAALAGVLRGHGGTIETGHEVRSLDELPSARAVLLDVAPEALARIAGEVLPVDYRDQLARFQRGPAAFKLDYALSQPIPWRAEVCRRAGVVHVGGSWSEVALAFDEVARGQHPTRPFVLVAQPSLFDRSRAPSGSSHHTAWAYCQVPEGSGRDMTEPLEAQIERFAPGFRDVVLARHTLGPRQLEAHDANLVGGDIWGGACDLRHLLFRPTPRLRPWTTPHPRLFLCSASTPPGPGVHGLCGFLAARAALRALRRGLI